ncbi:MAG: hypothetical protein AAGA77_19970 [Bacteroidota bacterium]
MNPFYTTIPFTYNGLKDFSKYNEQVIRKIKHLNFVILRFGLLFSMLFAGNCVIAQSYYGISGMAQVDAWPDETSTSYLVVHDHKYFSDLSTAKSPKDQDEVKRRNKAIANYENRFGMVVIPDSKKTKTKSIYQSIIENWGKISKKANDIESICKIPEKTNEFLALESGWKTFRRLFKISLRNISGHWMADIEQIGQLPGDIKEVEAMSCIKAKGKDEYYLVVGTRIQPKVTNSIRWEKIKLTSGSFLFLTFNNGVDYKGVDDSEFPRIISDFYVEPNGDFWISSTYDKGDAADDSDNGPFKSVVTLAGTIKKTSKFQIDLFKDPKTKYVIPTIKIEALGKAANDDAVISFGVDDEVYGGTIRQIFN